MRRAFAGLMLFCRCSVHELQTECEAAEFRELLVKYGLQGFDVKHSYNAEVGTGIYHFVLR